MKPFTALLGAAAGTHAADQMALATLPLTATLVLGAGPDLLGLLVAAQSAAWLLVSLPAGAWIDRLPRRRMLIVALALGLSASIVAVAAAATGQVLLLGLAAIAGASGTVVYVLTSVSLLPGLVAAGDLPRSNARLELARAIVSLAAPFVAGLLAQHLSPTWGYALAALGAALALVCVLALPPGTAPTTGAERPTLASAIRLGTAFVVRNELLRGISLCAIFWNFAFFAPARRLGAAGAGAARPRPGAYGPRAIDLWGGADPGRAGGPVLRPPAAALHDADFWTGRVGGRRRPVSGGALGQRLRPCRGRLFPGGLWPDAVADLPDDGPPARDALSPDGPGQCHGPDGDLRRPSAGRAGRRSRGGTGRPARGPAVERSTHMATPMPPPMHSVARPFFASRRCISCSSVFRMRAPEAPIGWPMAMAPPLTLTFDGSQPSPC
jgi:MFS family permease